MELAEVSSPLEHEEMVRVKAATVNAATDLRNVLWVTFISQAYQGTFMWGDIFRKKI